MSKSIKIIKDGEVIAQSAGADITENGMTAIAHANAPCVVEYYDGDEMYNLMRYYEIMTLIKDTDA